MKSKTFIVVLLCTLLAAALTTPAASAAGKAKKKSGPQVVGTDPEDDWGADVEPALTPLGNALGQELVEAAIGFEGKDTINFIIKLKSLPPWGGWPEISRYTWDFNVDGEFRELDGKWLNYTRGVCDPTSGQCPPPRDPGQQPFLLRGNCGVTPIGAINFTTCEELQLIHAQFDPSEGTITIPVSMKALGAKPGSKIEPGTNIFGGSISAAPAAWGTFGSFPMDTMTVTKTFVVKSGKKK